MKAENYELWITNQAKSVWIYVREKFKQGKYFAFLVLLKIVVIIILLTHIIYVEWDWKFYDTLHWMFLFTC